MSRDKIHGSLVVYGTDIVYDSMKLRDFVDHFLRQQRFQRSIAVENWDGIRAKRLSVKIDLSSDQDVWPNVYVLDRMQDYGKWADKLGFDCADPLRSISKRVLAFEEAGPTKYSFGDVWTLGCMLRKRMGDGFDLRSLMPGVSRYHLIFDDGDVASHMESFEGKGGFGGFCERFKRIC